MPMTFTPERPMSPSAPIFQDLSREQCDALLRRNYVGRIAFTLHNRVGVEPIGYVYDPNRVYMRTAPGSKLITLAHNPWVSFEVDEVEGPFDWQSVIVRGAVHVLHAEGNSADRRSYVQGLARLKQAFPGTLEQDDPAPFRTVIIMIAVDEITGRLASTR